VSSSFRFAVSACVVSPLLEEEEEEEEYWEEWKKWLLITRGTIFLLTIFRDISRAFAERKFLMEMYQQVRSR
jgi:hypothetical protein